MTLLAVLAGCGRAGFYKPDTDYQAFYADLRACEREATPNWAFCSGSGCQAQHGEHVRIRNNCMKARDWEVTRSGDRFIP